LSTPEKLQAQLQRATDLLERDQPKTAERELRDLLKTSPNDLKVQRMLGFAFLQQNRNDEAVRTFESVVKESNNNPVAALDLAKALSQAGDLPRAAGILSETLENVPTLTPGWFLLGDVLVEQRKFDAAQNAFSEAIANDPFRVQIDQCKRSIQEGDAAKAERILRHILEQDPLHSEALAGMEVLAMAKEDWIEAERLFKLIQKRTRFWPTLLMGLSQLFLMTGRAQEARQTLVTLVDIQPNFMMAWNMLGTANELLMRHDEAIASFEKSLELEPNQPRACVSIGNIQRVIGKRADSEKTFEDALRFVGMNGEAYWGLSNLKDYEFSDKQVADMRAALDRDASSLHNAAPIYFALGKAFEDRGNVAAAFSFYTKGNQLQKNTSGFDPELYSEEIDRIIATFSADMLRRASREHSSEEAPIFIIGMPRTGSTLVEQLLASHSQVDATMELPFIEQFVREIQSRINEIGPYPESVGNFAAADFEQLEERYLELASSYRRDAPRFIDKMPNNFVHLGLIHLLLPNAVFIDVMRHPLDTCLSGFKQRFAIGQPFSYSLADLGHYYRGYRRLMTHWESVLSNKVHRVIYEDLATDPEPVVRKLLDFCCLEFDSAFLTPEKTVRAIRTPSSEQVRQAISSDRVGYWKNFDAHLGPLQKLLAEDIAIYERGASS
jgi:tetratricopeptide (TPR) repeat protein